MSTRSGKRIHGSIHENAEDDTAEIKSERKTRGKRKKENNNEIATETKRINYVRYPSEEELAGNNEIQLKSAQKSQRNTLKDLNTATDSETLNDERTARLARRGRKTDGCCAENFEPSQTVKAKGKKKRNLKKTSKKTSGSFVVEDVVPINDDEKKTSNITKDSFHSAAGSPKKDIDEMVVDDQKLHVISSNSTRNDLECQKNEDMPLKVTRSKMHSMKNKYLEDTLLNTSNIKETKYKKKLTVEKLPIRTMTSKDNEENINNASNVLVNQLDDIHYITQIKEHTGILNTSDVNNLAVDNKIKPIPTPEIEMKVNSSDQLLKLDITNGNSAKKNSTYDKINLTVNATFENLNATFEKDEYVHSNNITEVKNSQKKKRNSTYDKVTTDRSTELNSTFDKYLPNDFSNGSDHLQDVTEKSTRDSNKKKRKSIMGKSLSENIENTSTIKLEVTYEKDSSNLTVQKRQNNIQEKEARKSRRLSKFSLDQDVSTNLNSTYDKISETDSQQYSRNNSICDKSAMINTTYEMDKNSKDTTFEKFKSNQTRRGSSLISNDTTDSTSEISKDISHVSITSDESMAENIVNTTPVLIESSMDESHNKINCENYNTTKVDIKTSNTEYQGFKDSEVKETNTATNIAKTPPKLEGSITESITSKTPLKREGTYTQAIPTPPKREGTFSESKNLATPKRKQDFTDSKPNTLKREGTYTELKTAATPLRREGTYTELNSVTTPSKVNEIIDNNHRTPLLSEGTFTKDDPEMADSPKPEMYKTPTRRKSMPSPGRTPFPPSRSSSKKKSDENAALNVTRSIEKPKRRSSCIDLNSRATKVMFCSPLDTPIVAGQMKGKVIKSNLKGSDKSFVFDDSVSAYTRPTRKRSYTQSETDSISSKRKRLTEGLQHSVDRLSRPRTASAAGKLQDHSTSKPSTSANKSKTERTPSKSKPDAKVQRTKLPNFAALHQKRFAKMESLDECQERKAKRARQLLTPTGSVSIIERVSPKETEPVAPPAAAAPHKSDTPKKSLAPPGYTRFGFKLNLEVNPFSFPANTNTKPKANRDNSVRAVKKRGALPSLAGATSARKDVAKQTVMREKSFTDKRDEKRTENRTVIKGVRTNRRFELQMQLRNV